jgi:hypothetical protein
VTLKLKNGKIVIMQKHTTDKPNYNTLTKGQLVEAILKLKVELNELKSKVNDINQVLIQQSQSYTQLKK